MGRGRSSPGSGRAAPRGRRNSTRRRIDPEGARGGGRPPRGRKIRDHLEVQGVAWARRSGWPCVRAGGDQPGRSASSPRGLTGHRAAGPARRHRVGEDVHDGLGRRRRRPARARDRPNKTLAAQLYSSSSPSFPKTRSNISSRTTTTTSRGVCPPHGHLHREGLCDQRADRQDAAQRDEVGDDRGDVIVVASVSCIYGLGSRVLCADDHPRRGRRGVSRNALLRRLIDLPVRAQRRGLPSRNVARRGTRGAVPATRKRRSSGSSTTGPDRPNPPRGPLRGLGSGN